jgi:tetratricopeptide (TPR) repeat protein
MGTRAIEAEADPAPPEQADGKPPAAESHVIDFILEDAEPEVVARENTRLQQLAAMDRRKDPERKQASNVDPTLELADIMVSLGLEQGAAKTLLEYAEANPRQALHHWLKLLDIYRSSGNQEDFKEATEKLRRNFNIQADDWAKANTAEAPTLENFSRLSQQLQQTWSRPEECIAYLRHLLEDNREGSRAGFPRPVAEEILLLIDVLKELSGANQPAGT